MKISFKKTKKLSSPVQELGLVLFLGLVGLVMHLGVNAADTQTVNASVSIQQISVSVTDAGIDYGILAVGSTMTTFALVPVDTQTATNDGNVSIDLSIQGQDSADWTLATTTGTDQYVHQISTDSGVGWTNVESGTYTDFATGVGTSSTEEFGLNLHMPSGTTATETQSVDVSVQASATAT